MKYLDLACDILILGLAAYGLYRSPLTKWAYKLGEKTGRVFKWNLCDHKLFSDTQCTALRCIKCNVTFTYEKSIAGIWGRTWDDARQIYLEGQLK